MISSRLVKTLIAGVCIVLLSSAAAIAATSDVFADRQTINLEFSSEETDPAEINMAIESLQRQINKLEEAVAASDAATAVKTWAEGVKTRNGALQYALMTSELKAKMYNKLSAGGWTTGTSSPWVGQYKIIAEKMTPNTVQYQVAFTYTDSTDSSSILLEYVTVSKQGTYWYVSHLENEEDDFTDEVEFEDGFYRPDFKNLPDEIKNWVENSKQTPALREKLYHGYRFVLITAGEKPTGGYSIRIEEVVEKADQLEVRVKTTKPGKDDMVTMALTYPFDLVIVEETELPLCFVDVGDSYGEK